MYTSSPPAGFLQSSVNTSTSGSSFSVSLIVMSLAAYMLMGTWGKSVRHGEHPSCHNSFIIPKTSTSQTSTPSFLTFFNSLVKGCSIFENCKRCNNGTWGPRDDFFIKGQYCAECRPGWSGGDCLSKLFSHPYFMCHSFIDTTNIDETLIETPNCSNFNQNVCHLKVKEH